MTTQACAWRSCASTRFRATCRPASTADRSPGRAVGRAPIDPEVRPPRAGGLTVARLVDAERDRSRYGERHRRGATPTASALLVFNSLRFSCPLTDRRVPLAGSLVETS